MPPSPVVSYITKGGNSPPPPAHRDPAWVCTDTFAKVSVGVAVGALFFFQCCLGFMFVMLRRRRSRRRRFDARKIRMRTLAAGQVPLEEEGEPAFKLPGDKAQLDRLAELQPPSPKIREATSYILVVRTRDGRRAVALPHADRARRTERDGPGHSTAPLPWSYRTLVKLEDEKAPGGYIYFVNVMEESGDPRWLIIIMLMLVSLIVFASSMWESCHGRWQGGLAIAVSGASSLSTLVLLAAFYFKCGQKAEARSANRSGMHACDEGRSREQMLDDYECDTNPLQQTLFVVPRLSIRVTGFMLVAAFFWALWLGCTLIVTSRGPYIWTSNGFFGCWLAVLLAARLFWQELSKDERVVAYIEKGLNADGGAGVDFGRARASHFARASLYVLFISGAVLALATIDFLDSSSQTEARFALYGSLVSTTLVLLLIIAGRRLPRVITNVTTLCLLVIWVTVTLISTFSRPFLVASNGFFACWVGLVCVLIFALLDDADGDGDADLDDVCLNFTRPFVNLAGPPSPVRVGPNDAELKTDAHAAARSHGISSDQKLLMVALCLSSSVLFACTIVWIVKPILEDPLESYDFLDIFDNFYVVLLSGVSMLLALMMLGLACFRAPVLGRALCSGACVPGGRCTLNLLLSFLLWFWWLAGTGVVTFYGPFRDSSNAYYFTWASFILSFVLLVRAILADEGLGRVLRSCIDSDGDGAADGDQLLCSDVNVGRAAMIILLMSSAVLVPACYLYSHHREAQFGMFAGALTIVVASTFLCMKARISKLTSARVAIFLFLLWLSVFAVCTFDQPFALRTANGYYAVWLGLFCTALHCVRAFQALSRKAASAPPVDLETHGIARAHTMGKSVRELVRSGSVVSQKGDATLLIHSICAFDVPDGDHDVNDSGLSDPYVRFCLVGAGYMGGADPWVVTSYQFNSLNPTWHGEQLRLPLPADLPRPASLRVEVIDKDVGSADDLLAAGLVKLHDALEGTVAEHVLTGQAGLPNTCRVSFSYSITDAAMERGELVKYQELVPQGEEDEGSSAGEANILHRFFESSKRLASARHGEEDSAQKSPPRGHSPLSPKPATLKSSHTAGLSTRALMRAPATAASKSRPALKSQHTAGRSAKFLLRSQQLASARPPPRGVATLRIDSIACSDVPNADEEEGGFSDTYVRMTLVPAVQDATSEPAWFVSTYKMNEQSPVFDGEVYRLPLLAADVRAGPVLQIEAIDKDFAADEDDLLGVGCVRLEQRDHFGNLNGVVSRMTLEGQAGLQDCTISFTYGIEHSPMTDEQLDSMIEQRAVNLQDRAGATLRLHSIAAFDVPDADLDYDGTGSSDPYVRFTLAGPNRASEEAPWICTSVMMNTPSPVYTDEEYLMPLPPDVGGGPILQVEVIDRDFGNDDDLLAVGAVRLDKSLEGVVERMTLQGQAGLSDCHLTFGYAIDPSFSMTEAQLKQMVDMRLLNLREASGGRLRIHGIAAFDLPNADLGIEGGGLSAPSVVFTLMHRLSVYEDDLPWVATTRKPNDLNPVFSGEELLLPLPADFGAGPVLQVEVVDQGLGTEGDVLCKATVQLDRSLRGRVQQLKMPGLGKLAGQGSPLIDFAFDIDPTPMARHELREQAELRDLNLTGGVKPDGQLRLHSICAFNVHQVTGGGGEAHPCYVRFALTDSGTDDGTDWNVTRHTTNRDGNPVYHGEVVVMRLPQSTKRPVRLLVQLCGSDGPLAEGRATLKKGLQGTASPVELVGQNGFPSCQVSFSYGHEPLPLSKKELREVLLERTRKLSDGAAAAANDAARKGTGQLRGLLALRKGSASTLNSMLSVAPREPSGRVSSRSASSGAR